MSDLMKKMAKVDEIGDLKKRICEVAKSAMDRGVENVNAAELGEVVDMIKDLAEAEEKCMKACYYESVVCAMKKAEEDGDTEWDSDRMGYDNWRYPSSGRFASKGHGSRMGYVDPMMMDRPEEFRMGYDGERSSTSSGNSSSSMSGRSGYGDEYYKYRMARKHYTETKSMTDKEEMDSHANMHMNEAISTMKDIWREADPNLRKQMKAQLAAMMNDMN